MNSEITFASLGLADAILHAVTDAGYTHPTAIQAQAIPQVMKGGDLLAAAQTGTGKTAGFTLPILHRLLGQPAKQRKAGTPRALIMTPTRELAAQVEESVRLYSRNTDIRSLVLFGGVNINPQIRALQRPIDIIVATPGRLLDHCRQKTIDLSQVEIVVLDEADRMLDMGFIRDIRRILSLMPSERQNLLFSATFSPEIRELARNTLRSPIEISVTPRNTASELITQQVVVTEQAHKRDLISHIIRQSGWHQVLVFCRTKHGANRLAEKLSKDGLNAAALHGNKSQSARTRALDGFKTGKVVVLVATDIAARGIDIDQLPYVINFELPQVPEDYVHRIGRTGRAGSEGLALSLVDRSEIKLLKAIERLINRDIDHIEIADFEPPARSAQSESDEPRRRNAPRHGEGARNGQANRRPGGRDNAGRGAQPAGGRARTADARGRRPQPQRTRSSGSTSAVATTQG
ncbi:DEAD/DEAH box helicase [Paenalcaligenes niemegkensis]|uniref:DEAD/DEAH box helicase n=1 Tax=Paenalcaligenes niemegkensis TaxID=2895469 RepID=UPI001EE9636B|nr:DEAD/DEAH box helicase [Paenalcaligenes niemegkensis]MCQ9618031.1 DEAD/DEAH box helicase [Paenalcaligenes niemegkensis]